MADEQVADDRYEISWAKAIIIGTLATAAILAFGMLFEGFAQLVGYEERGH